MAISMGVLCEKCGTLHLINSETKNHVDSLPRTDSNIFAPEVFSLLGGQIILMGRLAILCQTTITPGASRSAGNISSSRY